MSHALVVGVSCEVGEERFVPGTLQGRGDRNAPVGLHEFSQVQRRLAVDDEDVIVDVHGQPQARGVLKELRVNYGPGECGVKPV